jgi:2-haloalkanoic acid dehalogenase type II
MSKKGEWPRAIFYDSKNTLYAWDVGWVKACTDILKKYDSKVDMTEFRKLWNKFLTSENHRSAFGNFQSWTDSLMIALGYAGKLLGVPVNPQTDVKFLTELWDEIQPFDDVAPAWTRQKEITKVLSFSNVETEYLEMMVGKVGVMPDFMGDMDKSHAAKPSPRAYYWMLENASRELKIELNCSNVLYVAGVQWDCQAAMALGMKTVWIHRPYRYPAPIEGVQYDYEVDSLHEVTRIVEQSLAGK